MIDTVEGFLKVTIHTTNDFFKFNIDSISLIKLKVAFSVDEFGLKPNCVFANMLLLFKCWYNLTEITFSKIFKKAVRKDIGL